MDKLKTSEAQIDADVALPFVATGWNSAWTKASLAIGAPLSFIAGWFCTFALLDIAVREHIVAATVCMPFSLLVGTLAPLIMLACQATRYRLVIDAGGIAYTQLSFLGLPLKTRRFHLDAKLEEYEPWECDEPEGRRGVNGAALRTPRRPARGARSHEGRAQ